VAVLERGKLVQLGSHDELLAREGPYRRLWQLQQSALLEPDPASAMGVSA
jgi:ABC-type multidrug transport system fused ATPase/permease subunit